MIVRDDLRSGSKRLTGRRQDAELSACYLEEGRGGRGGPTGGGVSEIHRSRPPLSRTTLWSRCKHVRGSVRGRTRCRSVTLVDQISGQRSTGISFRQLTMVNAN